MQLRFFRFLWASPKRATLFKRTDWGLQKPTFSPAKIDARMSFTTENIASTVATGSLNSGIEGEYVTQSSLKMDVIFSLHFSIFVEYRRSSIGENVSSTRFSSRCTVFSWKLHVELSLSRLSSQYGLYLVCHVVLRVPPHQLTHQLYQLIFTPGHPWIEEVTFPHFPYIIREHSKKAQHPVQIWKDLENGWISIS